MRTRKVNLIGLGLAAALALSGVIATTSAVAQDQIKDQTQLRLQDQIYGSELMTQTERDQYRTQLRTMTKEQDREAFRLQHHKQMQDRARVKGVTLPNEPPASKAGAVGGMGGGAGGAGSGASGKK